MTVGHGAAPLWLWPLAMCLVLAGIHGYLGIHVLKRKVIFVDLAMAQIAALGAAYGVLLGYDPGEDSLPVYLFSFGFTFAGAAVIALARMRQERVPQEAFIGIIYASASAIAILLLAKTSSEGEHIKHMLVGRFITVTSTEVWRTALIYVAVGAFHWIFRSRFFRISEDPEGAAREGMSIRTWDFLFYVSFGLVITSSVAIAGVLLVFSFLVVPAVIAMMFAEATRARVAIAWIVGAAVSIMGIFVSNAADLPTGPSIVASFTAVLVAAGAVHYLASHGPLSRTLRNLVGGGLAVSLIIWGTTFLQKHDEHSHASGDLLSQLVEALKSDDESAVIDALEHIRKHPDRHAVDAVIELQRRTKSDRVLERGGRALVALDATAGLPALKEACRRDLDPDLRVHLAESILDLRDPEGFLILIDVLDRNPPAIVKEEALTLIRGRARIAVDDKAPVPGLRTWWAEHGSHLRWRRGTGWTD